MTDLFSPGDERADALMSDGALLGAMVAVEEAWLRVLAKAGVAPVRADAPLAGLVSPADVPALARASEGGGNPVIPLVALLRDRTSADPEVARWLHRGLTSQDVLDTALVLCLREVADAVLRDVHGQVGTLRDLARAHRGTVQAGRTLTQHAVPTTFGLTVAGWLHAVLDAATDLRAGTRALPVQAGGAAGTLAASLELAALAGLAQPAAAARALTADLAAALGLADSAPWHTRRRPLTRVGDALVACTDAFGKIAGDVLVRTRPEIGELAESAAEGRGGSSTMPHKQNPVLSVLVTRAALSAPLTAAQLHVAAASAVDDRPAGAWHAEWPALRTLGRLTAVAASQTTDLLAGLTVDAGRMRAHAEAAGDDLLAEQASLRALHGRDAGTEVEDYLGAAALLVDEAVARADAFLEDRP